MKEETGSGGLIGKSALVTGAASGIGRAIAIALAEAGARVALADRNAAGASELASLLRGRGLAGLELAGDAGDRRDTSKWVTAAGAAHGPVSILVNNAGMQHVSPVHEFDVDRWEELIGVMLTGPFLLTRAALPGMLASGWGRIINVGSIHSLVASRYKSAYCAAKFGLLGLTRTVALETAGSGVTVNCVCPSYVRTPLIENQVPLLAEKHGIPRDEVIRKVILPACPLGRLLEPEEVAALVLYLCSDSAGGLTGAAIPLDGGWTAQ